jgi:carbonic anhydrase
MESLAGIFVFIIFFGTIAAIVAGIRYGFGRIRSKQMREIASSLGLPFSDIKDEGLLLFLKPFELFKEGSGQSIKNVFTIDEPDMIIRAFDHEYSTGGKSRGVHQYTVLMATSKLYNLSHFKIAPEYKIQRMLSFIGGMDINFPEFPQFSKMYWLTGRDEERIRAFFTPSRIKFFEEHPKLCIEASGDTFILYKIPRLSAIDMPAFLDDASDVCRILKD